MMPKVGSKVRISNPVPGHAHMRGLEGRVLDVTVCKTTRVWIVKVRFFGGSGIFAPDELEMAE